MAKSPRLQVVLAPEVYDSISRISRYMGKSMSAVVSETLSETAPLLHELADTLEQASNLATQLPGSVAAKLKDLDRDAKALEQGALSVLEHFQEEAAKELEERQRQVVSVSQQFADQDAKEREELERQALSAVERAREEAASRGETL